MGYDDSEDTLKILPINTADMTLDADIASIIV
jgi:hypothetical protein